MKKVLVKRGARITRNSKVGQKALHKLGVTPIDPQLSRNRHDGVKMVRNNLLG